MCFLLDVREIYIQKKFISYALYTVVHQAVLGLMLLFLIRIVEGMY